MMVEGRGGGGVEGGVRGEQRRGAEGGGEGSGSGRSGLGGVAYAVVVQFYQPTRTISRLPFSAFAFCTTAQLYIVQFVQIVQLYTVHSVHWMDFRVRYRMIKSVRGRR